MFDFNKAFHQRDAILQINVDWNDEDQHGGVVSFDNIDIHQVSALIEQKYIDPGQRQNRSPTVDQFYCFIKRYPAARAFGYAVSPLREDYRVSIEGLFVAPDDVSQEIREEFHRFCLNADEMESDALLRCWWD